MANSSESLFTSGNCDNENYSIDPNTGATKYLSNIPGVCNAVFNSGTFSPFTKEFLGEYNFFPATDLSVLDPITGNVTAIG